MEITNNQELFKENQYEAYKYGYYFIQKVEDWETFSAEKVTGADMIAAF